MHVHGVGQYAALELGQVVLQDRRGHGRLLAVINHVGGVVNRRLGNVGLGGNASQWLLHALHVRHRGIELAADAGEATGSTRSIGRHTGCARRQRNAAPHRQAFHQHAPALPGHVLTANDVVQRDEHVLAPDRAVKERRANRAMATADFHALGVTGNQCAGNTVILGVTQQAVRVKHAERQAHHGGHRREGDPALLEIQAQTEHFLTVYFLLADNAGVRQGGGVRASARPSQAKAGDFTAIGQTRQVVVLLLFGAVLDQQLARTQGVGHAYGDHQHLVGGQLLQDRRLGLGGKFQAAILLGNDHAEEFFFLQEIPEFLR